MQPEELQVGNPTREMAGQTRYDAEKVNTINMKVTPYNTT